MEPKEKAKLWRKMIRARSLMDERGFELEIDHFVRVSLSDKRGHQIKPWLSYVRSLRMRSLLVFRGSMSCPES